MKKIIITFCLVLSVAALTAQVLNVSVSGRANFNSSLYTINDAGEDFPSSVSDESSVSISLSYGGWDKWFGPDVQWRVLVNKSELNWPSNLKVEIARKGNGAKDSWFGPTPSIYNGLAYQTISNNPTYFFSGRYGIRDIPLKLKLSGASLTMGAKQFDTSIMFTVYEE